MPPAGITSPPPLRQFAKKPPTAHTIRLKNCSPLFAGPIPGPRGAADACVFGLVVDTADHGGLSRAQ